MTPDGPQPALPLAGIRVLDCSRVLAGPFATMLLADLGADVIKLEPPGGDETRWWGPPWWGDAADGRSAYFASVNRNKRSLVVDLRTNAGRNVLDRLARACDLLVHNARPSVAARLGLDAERLRDAHPHLVIAALGGFPGERAERPAYDLLAQAASGLMAISGERGRPPTRTGVAVLDLLAGLELAVGALASLIGRARGEPVVHPRVGLVEASVTGLVNVLANHLATGHEPERWGSQHPNIVPYQVFAARDGHLALAVGTDAQFGRLLEVLALERDPRHATNPGRLAHREELVARLAAAIGRWTRDDLLTALEAADVPAAPVNSVGEALRQMEAASPEGWLLEMGGMRLAPAPIRLAGRRLPLRLAPPRLGEHTDAVLAEAGCSADEISVLRAAGAVG